MASLIIHGQSSRHPAPPPTLLYPKRRKAKKQGHEEALRSYFESVIERYQKGVLYIQTDPVSCTPK